METLHELLRHLYNVESIIQWGGLAMICAIIFAETGLMIGFFLSILPALIEVLRARRGKSES